MKKIVVLTGAGMSVESGLKTFRDADAGCTGCHQLQSRYRKILYATRRTWKEKAGCTE